MAGLSHPFRNRKLAYRQNRQAKLATGRPRIQRRGDSSYHQPKAPRGTKAKVAQGEGKGYCRIFSDAYVRVTFGELDLGTRPCGPGYLNEFVLTIPALEPKAYQVKVTGTESGLELKGLFTITEPSQDEAPAE
jgi:hypothetical protein